MRPLLVLVLVALFGTPVPCGAAEVRPLYPRRIVSLAPAVTEILFELGLGGRVVGVTSLCDRPAEARRRPTVGGMANPSMEAIVALRPDLVVMTRDGNPKEIAQRLTALGIATHVFTAARLADLPAGIRRMGRALGAERAAGRLAANLQAAAAAAVPPAGRRRRALFVVWPDPLLAAGSGTIIDDAMQLSGFSNIAADARGTYPRLSLETVLERQPEVIIVGAAGGMQVPLKEMLHRLRMLDAVQRGRVCTVGDALYRPGPRVVEGIAELRRCGALP
ncbi:MAG: ABC transporter substrate-binding protein [Geobacter sp.]|nr:ABC transporter substrate-binding protein [Geobacter sp.]